MLHSRNTPRRLQTTDTSKYPQGRFFPKPCRWCCQEFQPTSPSQLYCGQQCIDNAWANAYLMTTYGIPLETYLRMWDQQARRCAICGSEGFELRPGHQAKLVIDHCHITGNVRGLLCHHCNRALGLMGDSPKALRKAAAYLEEAARLLKVQRLSERSTPEANAGGSAQPHVRIRLDPSGIWVGEDIVCSTGQLVAEALKNVLRAGPCEPS